MNTPPKHGKRWYDNYPQLGTLFDVAQDLPLTLQDYVGETLLEFAQTQQRMGENTELRGLKSKGPDAIVSMYKSRLRQRNYDTNSLLFKAFSLLMNLSENQLRLIEAQSTPLLDLVNGHLLAHPHFTTRPSTAETNTHLEATRQKWGQIMRQQAASYKKRHC